MDNHSSAILNGSKIAQELESPIALEQLHCIPSMDLLETMPNGEQRKFGKGGERASNPSCITFLA